MKRKKKTKQNMKLILKTKRKRKLKREWKRKHKTKTKTKIKTENKTKQKFKTENKTKKKSKHKTKKKKKNHFQFFHVAYRCHSRSFTVAVAYRCHSKKIQNTKLKKKQIFHTFPFHAPVFHRCHTWQAIVYKGSVDLLTVIFAQKK